MKLMHICTPKRVDIVNQFASMTIDERNETIDLKHIDLPNFASKFGRKKVPETSSYVEIHGAKKRKIVKKTSLCWLLSSNVVKLSSDRVYRVRDSKIQSCKEMHAKKKKSTWSIYS